MGPTAHLDDSPLRFQVDAVVTVESVGLQVAAIIFEEGGRAVPLVIRGVVEHRQRVERVAHVRPEVARVLLLPPGIADLHRGVVRVQDVRSEHHADRQAVQRLEEFGRLEPPAVHRLPGDADALPLEDAFQAVQRQVVGTFADDHLSHEPRPGQSTGPPLRGGAPPRAASRPAPRSVPPASGRSLAAAPCGRISCGHGRRQTASRVASRASRSCSRRGASARSPCGALAAPNAPGPSAALPATARPTASAPPGRRAAGRDRAEARHPCSCPLLRSAAREGSPVLQNSLRPLQPARST